MTPTLALIGKDPAAGSAKTRIAATLGAEAARAIAEALVLDSAAALVATAPAGARLVFFHDPPDAGPSLRALGLPARYDLVAQPSGSLGDRLAHLSGQELAAGACACVIAAIDSPFVIDPTIHAVLPSRPGEIVLGPCEDGGYWAVGLDAPAPEIFAVEMSTDDVLAETVARGEALGRPVRLLPPMPDVDREEDLERLAATGLLARAPRTALAWTRVLARS